MRIAERLARLEQGGRGDPFMNPAEIAQAAERHEADLIGDGSLGCSVKEAMAGWHSLVADAAEPWLQRVYANMSYADLFA